MNHTVNAGRNMVWLPVTETEPSDGEDVILCGTCCGGAHHHSAQGYRNGDWWNVGGDKSVFEPTHYMPLPLPTKKVTVYEDGKEDSPQYFWVSWETTDDEIKEMVINQFGETAKWN